MPIRNLLARFAKPPPAKPPARLIKTVQQLHAQRSDNPALAAIDLELAYLSRCCEHYDDIADELRQCCEALSALLLSCATRKTRNCAARHCGLCWSLCNNVCSWPRPSWRR
ncbi:hypothetical protein JOS77_22345 [Chromobacterium haemolyticum]|nr:hypothetical protein JOS77_22345 [Chromobacterium haemolyticum]